MSSWRRTAVFYSSKARSAGISGRSCSQTKEQAGGGGRCTVSKRAGFRLFCCKFWIFQGGIRGIDSCGKAIPVESLRRKSGFRFHAACCGGRQCRGECAAEKRQKAEEAVAEMPPACRPAGTTAYRRSREKNRSNRGKSVG